MPHKGRAQIFRRHLRRISEERVHTRVRQRDGHDEVGADPVQHSFDSQVHTTQYYSGTDELDAGHTSAAQQSVQQQRGIVANCGGNTCHAGLKREKSSWWSTYLNRTSLPFNGYHRA